MRTPRFGLLLALGGSALLGLTPRASIAAPAAATSATPPVKLVVVLAVDGLSWPRLDSYRGWLNGGFARLLTEGQVETACHYAHLNTETGPGHASLGTGAPPRVHGIVANRWFEQNPPRRLYCTDQPDPARVPGQPPLFLREIESDGRLHVFANQRTMELWRLSGEMGNQATTRIGEGPNGETLVFDSDDAITLYNLHHGRPPEVFPPSGAPIPGPMNLRIPTLGDRLVEASPESRVVSLSGKDRGAIFLAGKNPRHAVYWFDRETGRFVSSNAYEAHSIVGTAMRETVKRFNANHGSGKMVGRFGITWHPLELSHDVAAKASALPQPEANLGRFQSPDLGLGFDHDLATDPRGYFNAIYGSPFQDELLTDLALATLEDRELRLGRRGVPDLLALSYSAHDVVSHNYGNESAEELDALRRLDRQLARLLAALDTLAQEEPAGSVVLALSSDHGFAPIPEVARRRDNRRAGGRLLSDNAPESAYPNFLERLSRGLCEALDLPAGCQAIFGSEGWIVAYDHAGFPKTTIESPKGPAGRTVTIADLDRVFPSVVEQLFGEEIESVLRVSERDRWPTEGAAVFAQNDFDPARSGDAFLIPRANVLMHWDAARGSGHGSHHEYDTHVPLIFWGGPFRARVSEQPSTPYDLAPTLADLLGVPLPDATGASRSKNLD